MSNVNRRGRRSVVVAAWLVVFAVAVVTLSTLSPAATPEGSSLPFTEMDRRYWALQPVVRPEVPEVKNADWVRNPIDAFILARLEAEGLAPAPEADRPTLLRRVTFDVTGLPPTPEQIDAFVSDTAPQAYERLVDRLHFSPHYGEAWARHWLDLVRYAETDGFKADVTRPNAWRYRDWVIRALNNDKPYDKFIREQLAGDEIAPDDPDALVATGFLRHWPYEDNQAHVEQQWQDILNDITDVTGQALLGLTIGCARCHDHKYDPLLQKDYYRLQGFFAALEPWDRAAVPEAQAEYQRQLSQWEDSTREIRREMRELEAPHRDEFLAARLGRFPKPVQAILEIEPHERTPYQAQIASLAERQLIAESSAMRQQMKGDAAQRWDALDKQLGQWSHLRPELPAATPAVRDIGPDASPVRMPGRRDSAEAEVEPGFLSILDPRPAHVERGANRGASTGRRTALARWVASPDNPLTARVMVNRLWQFHFGRGLVATPNDFGRQGEPPTHPELLDWLASEFVARGWSLKAMHRLMLTSATYRQASRVESTQRAGGFTPPVPGEKETTQRAGGFIPPVAAEVDPDNKLLWKMRMRRLEGEELRDALLAVSGELSLEVGGPSIYPELPEGLSQRYAWEESADPAARSRRSIYVFLKRNLRYPLFEAFDMPDTHESCARRNVTTTAPQALLLMNGRMGLDRAAAFATRVLRESTGSAAARIRTAYRLAYGREASDDEVRFAAAFLDGQRPILSRSLEGEEKLTLPAGATAEQNPARAAALVDLCHVLLNSNEFVYVD